MLNSWLLRRSNSLKNSLFVGCLMSQQHACVSQGWICSDNCSCYHTETEVSDQTFNLTQSQYTDTGLTSPSADPVNPGAWQGSHWSAIFSTYWYDSTWKNPVAKGIRTPDLPLLRRTATKPMRLSIEQIAWFVFSWQYHLFGVLECLLFIFTFILLFGFFLLWITFSKLKCMFNSIDLCAGGGYE